MAHGNDERERVSELLLEAIESLPEPDRKLVMGFLINCALVTSRRRMVEGGPVGVLHGAATLSVSEAAQPTGPGGAPPPAGSAISYLRTAGMAGGAGQQLVPVRFPEEQHARLKEWCARNGFSMAVVIRGLVDRFLDEYDPREA